MARIAQALASAHRQVLRMAFFDDPRFLLSHIDHSFITGDDTGNCEMIMLDQAGKRIADLPNYELDYESELSQQCQSYDITQDYMSHRRRSNTAQRLEKIRKEKIDRSKTKTIFWQRNKPQHLTEDSDLLATGSKTDTRPKTPPAKSGLTQLLDRYPSIPKNPFDEFALFDGRVFEVSEQKKFRIVVAAQGSPRTTTDTPSNKRHMDITISSAAKIHDLIGLICWQYSNEGLEPPLEPDVSRYCLRIVEDNGEIDPDFPSLNPREPLAKFGFSTLALTEKSISATTSNHNLQSPEPAGSNVSTARHTDKIVNVVNGPKASRVKGQKAKFPIFRKILFKDASLDTF